MSKEIKLQECSLGPSDNCCFRCGKPAYELLADARQQLKEAQDKQCDGTCEPNTENWRRANKAEAERDEAQAKIAKLREALEKLFDIFDNDDPGICLLISKALADTEPEKS